MIYVPGDAQIDATGEASNPIGADGVTLASNRGINGSDGGLIFADDEATANVDPLIDFDRSNIRITGLRMRGNNPDVLHTDNHHDHATGAIGIREGASGAEVDNCELSAWVGQALNIWAEGAHIHNSYLHHNQMDGLGYGAELQYGFHYFTCNIFDKCRHSIAGVGRPGNGYLARQNVIGTASTEYGHALDMHGDNDGEGPGGNLIILEQNTIMRRPPDSSRPRTEQDGGIHIRGGEGPREHCYVRNNWFRHPEKPTGNGGRYEAWWQSVPGSSLMNMTVKSNHYGLQETPPEGVGAARGSATIEFED